MMLIIQSNEGKVKIAAIGRTAEICAETASAIKGLADQIIQPCEDTADKLVALKMLHTALEYAIDSTEKEVLT